MSPSASRCWKAGAVGRKAADQRVLNDRLARHFSSELIGLTADRDVAYPLDEAVAMIDRAVESWLGGRRDETIAAVRRTAEVVRRLGRG